MLMSIRRVSSAAKELSRTSSNLRSFLSVFCLAALRAATVGMTPDDAADDRVEEEEAVADEPEVLRLDELGCASADEADVLSRVDLRAVAGMLIQASAEEVRIGCGRVTRSIWGAESGCERRCCDRDCQSDCLWVVEGIDDR